MAETLGCAFNRNPTICSEKKGAIIAPGSDENDGLSSLQVFEEKSRQLESVK